MDAEKSVDASVRDGKSPGWKDRVLLDLSEIRSGFQVAVIKCPKAFVREVQMVYPKQNLNDLLAIVTCQKAKHDLCEIGDDIEKEKDALLVSFTRFARRIVNQLKEAKQWADYIDPCSGLPATQDHANRGYSEVDGLAVLLRFGVQSAGPCKVATHPTWGTRFYPATMFTTAPFASLRSAIESVRDGAASK